MALNILWDYNFNAYKTDSILYMVINLFHLSHVVRLLHCLNFLSCKYFYSIFLCKSLYFILFT